MKNKETLEEAAEIYAEENAIDSNISYHNLYAPLEYAFKNGAKWQQEQNKNKFSEEEVQLILSKLLTDIKNGNAGNSVKWFEQFKKK